MIKHSKFLLDAFKGCDSNFEVNISKLLFSLLF